MSAYKEILLTTSQNQTPLTTTLIPTTTTIDSSQRKIQSFTESLSLPNHMINIIVASKTLTIQTITMLSCQSNSTNETTSFHEFKSNIIKSVLLLPDGNNPFSYKLIVLTSNLELKLYLMSIENNASKVKYTYNDILRVDSTPTYLEKIYEINKNIFFAVGTVQGSVYIVKLLVNSMSNQLEINMEQTYEEQQKGNNLLSFFSRLSFVGGNNAENGDGNEENSINSIKYIGNNLLCYIRNNFIFEIINLSKKKLIYKDENLVMCKGMNLVNSKIVSKVMDYSFGNDGGNYQKNKEKIFQIIIYLNHSISSELISFEVWFYNQSKISNIAQLITSVKSDNINNNNNNEIDLGSQMTIKNKRIIPFSNETIIDINLSTDNNILWIAKQNSKEEFTIIDSLVLDSDNNDSNEQIDLIKSSDNAAIDSLERKYKNLLYIISQIKTNNQAQFNSINKILLSIISYNDEFIHTGTLIDFINKTYMKNFTNKKGCVQFIKESFIDDESVNVTIDNEIIIPIIYNEYNNNRIISINSFTTNDLKGTILIRENGISILKKVSTFEYIDILIGNYEYYIRESLYKDNEINKNQNYNNTFMNNITSFIHKEISINENNSFYIIMAMLRIYLTEINLLLKNEYYLFDLKNMDNNKDINMIKYILEEIISKNITVQYNTFSSINFMDEIIYDIYSNNMPIINSFLNIIAKEYDKIVYKAQLNNINNNIIMNNNNTTFNIIYCEIFSKIISEKLSSMYNIIRDVNCFFEWKYKYADDLEGDEDNGDKLFTALFKQMVSAIVVGNHFIYFNMETVVNIDKDSLMNNKKYCDKESSYLDYFVLQRFGKVGLKYDYFYDYLISYFIKEVAFISDIEDNISYEVYKMMFYYKDYELMSFTNNILNTDENLKLIYMEILCQAQMKNTSTMEKLIKSFYISLSYIKSGKNLLAILNSFYSFYNTMPFSKFNSIANMSQINDPLVQGYLYLENMLSKYLTFNELCLFYYKSFTFIYPPMKSISDHELINNNFYKNLISDYISKLITSCLIIDYDLAISMFSQITKDKIIYSISKKGIILSFIQEMKNFYIKNNIILDINYDKIVNEVKNPIVLKLLTVNYGFLLEICEEINNICEENLKVDLNNNNNNEINNPNQMDQNDNSNNNNFEEIKVNERESDNFAYFKFLINIYFEIGEYEKCSIICEKNASLIMSSIINENLSINELMIYYKNHIDLVDTSLKCKNKINFDDIKDYSLIINKKMSEIKRDLLLYYITECNKENSVIQSYFPEEQFNQIKRDEVMLNNIFKLSLYDFAINHEIVKYLNEKNKKIFVFNMIKGLNKINNYDLLNSFINNVIDCKGFIETEIKFLTVDFLFGFNCKINAGEYIMKLKEISMDRTMEVLVKYQKVEFINDLVDDMIKKNERLPHNLVKGLKIIASMNTGNKEFVEKINYLIYLNNEI